MDHYPNASSHSSRSSCTGSSSSPAEAPPHSPFNSHIRTSCDACKRLKIKCEKNGDNCAHCLNRGITCVTTLVERKKRQPTRSTSLLDIESRIKRMESVITASGLDTQSNSVAASSPVASESPLASPTKLIDRLSTLVISGEGKTRYFGGASGLTLFSPQGLDWIAEKTGSDELSRFIHTLATDVHTPPEKTATELYRPLFASEREPFPPKHIADRYVDYFFESYNNLSPLYDKAAFDGSYELQYSGDPPKGLAWYASLNIVLCLGCLLLQVRDKNNTPENPERKVWKKYLRNASGCLLDLIFEEGSLEAVQALVGMAVVHQVHLEPQAVHILVAAAGRLSYGIGLHRDLKDRGISEAEVIQRRNVFWVVYTMDKTVALRLGHPSVMNDDDIGIDLPLQECPHKVQADGTTTRVDMFRYRVQLARLESRVYSKLYSVRGQTRSPLERLRLVGELDKTLIDWKERLPVEIQPEQPIQCPADLVLPTILMHFAYFNCLTIIHRVSIHHGSWTSTHYGRHESTLQDDRHLNPRVYASEAICLAAARQSIQLLKSVDFETRAVDKSSLWMLLYYPLSNLLTLFANTLQNPADPEAPSDLKLMDIVISLLSEPAFHVNVPTANAARLFVELGNITRKLVEKTNCNIAKPAKRARDEYDHKQDQSQTSEQEPCVLQALSVLENSGQQSGSMLHSASVINNGDNSTTSSLEAHALGDNIQHHTSNMPHPLYPSGTIDDDLFTMSNTPMFFENAIPPLDATSFTPLMSEYFEWDLANLWNFEQGI